MALVKYDAGYANGSYGYGESQPQMNYYRHPGSVTTVMAKMHGVTVNPRSDGGAVKKHTPLKEVREEEDSEDEESEEEDSEDEESEESDSEESEDESDSEEESDCEEKLAPAPGPYGGAAAPPAGGYGGYGLDMITLKCAREKQTGGKLGGGAGWAAEAEVAAGRSVRRYAECGYGGAAGGGYGGSKLCPEPRGQRHDDYYSKYWQEKKHASRHWPAPRVQRHPDSGYCDEDEHTQKKKKKKKKKKHTGKLWPRTGGPHLHQPEEQKVYKFYF